MALRKCWQRKGLQGKEYNDRYRQRIDTINRVHKPGYKKNLGRFGTAAGYRTSLTWNWLLLIPCVIIEIFRLLPVWIFELFRFCPRPGRRVLSGGSFLIVGHRGAAAYEIENTIPACEKALHQYGADALEIDICMTKDEQVVVWHDWDPDSTISIARQLGLEPHVKYRPFVPTSGNKRKPVHELSLEELRKNYGYTERKGKPKKLAAYIPTLREFFQWAAEQQKLRGILLDVKTPAEMKDLVPVMMGKINEILEEIKPVFKVIFLTPEKDILRAMKEAANHLNYSYDMELPMVIVLDPAAYSSVRTAIDLGNRYATIGRPALQLGPWTTYRRTVKYDVKLREGYNSSSETPVEQLIGWTINRRREMKCLIGLGVDGILTDRPDRLKALFINIQTKQKKKSKPS